MWGEWVNPTLILTVLKTCEETPQHTYQFLTKNPSRYGQPLFDLPKNGWYGTTVDGTERTKNNLEDLMISTNGYCHITRFVSFEPLLKRVEPDLFGISWVIIGADSTKGAQKPPVEWAAAIVKEARKHNIPVWIKENYLLTLIKSGGFGRFKEMPERPVDRISDKKIRFKA